MRYKIFNNEKLFNTIDATEDFCIAYCQKNGYTYELIPDQNNTAEDNTKASTSIECFNTLTYTGTGVYGESNPTTIQLPQTPKHLSIYSDTSIAIEWVTGMSQPICYLSTPISAFQVLDDGTISFYSTSPTNQLNNANKKYTVVFMY